MISERRYFRVLPSFLGRKVDDRRLWTAFLVKEEFLVKDTFDRFPELFMRFRKIALENEQFRHFNSW